MYQRVLDARSPGMRTEKCALRISFQNELERALLFRFFLSSMENMGARTSTNTHSHAFYAYCLRMHPCALLDRRNTSTSLHARDRATTGLRRNRIVSFQSSANQTFQKNRINKKIRGKGKEVSYRAGETGWKLNNNGG